MKIFIFINLIYVASVLSEYRVYQYQHLNKELRAGEKKVYQKLSTLPPQSYIAYFGGSSAIKIDLLRTWICPGYTGQLQKICSSPYLELSEIEN